MVKKEIRVSGLGKTWLLDLDGTILVHNGYKLPGGDRFLDGAEEFLKSIPKSDSIIFLTSRTKICADQTEHFLKEHGIRFNQVIYGLPYGERIVLNDRKPSGLDTAIAVNTERNQFMEVIFSIDESL